MFANNKEMIKLTNAMTNKVIIKISKDTRKKLRQLGIGESYDTMINRIIKYIEFHPEYWDKEI